MNSCYIWSGFAAVVTCPLAFGSDVRSGHTWIEKDDRLERRRRRAFKRLGDRTQSFLILVEWIDGRGGGLRSNATEIH